MFLAAMWWICRLSNELISGIKNSAAGLRTKMSPILEVNQRSQDNYIFISLPLDLVSIPNDLDSLL